MEARTGLDVLTAIKARRSIRRYQARPVEQRDLELILDAARWAPSASNGQPWDFVVVRQPEVRRALVDLILGAHRQYFSEAAREAMPEAEAEQLTSGTYNTLFGAPVFVVVCLHRKRQLAADAYDAASYRWDLVSVAAAIENLLLAATAVGLGTCWMGAPGLRETEIKRLLDIPAHVQIVALTPLGYPDETPEPRPRDDLAEIVHEGRWGTARPRQAEATGYGALLSSAPASAAELVERGCRSFAAGNYTAAIADFDEAARREPSLAITWRNRAAAHFCLADYGRAIEDYGRAIALNPGDTEAHYYRGLAHRAIGRYVEAVADFSRAIETGMSAPTVYFSRGAAYTALGATAQARADLDRFLATSTDPQARAVVDQLLGQQGR